MKTAENYALLVARILMALIFVVSGAFKIAGFADTVGYIASKGLPFPAVAAVAAIIVELGGGLMLIVGWKVRWAALAMMLFTFAAAFLECGCRCRTKPDDSLYEKYLYGGWFVICCCSWQRKIQSGKAVVDIASDVA